MNEEISANATPENESNLIEKEEIDQQDSSRKSGNVAADIGIHFDFTSDLCSNNI